jgi:hypothetical protein
LLGNEFSYLGAQGGDIGEAIHHASEHAHTNFLAAAFWSLAISRLKALCPSVLALNGENSAIIQ